VRVVVVGVMGEMGVVGVVGVGVRVEVEMAGCPGEHGDCADFVAGVEFGAADEALAGEGFWVCGGEF